MSDLGIESHDDLVRRNGEVASALPGISGLANEIIVANPAVVKG